MKNRIIMHVDLNAFFASVEQRQHPEFRGKPLVVGADPKGGKGRGVVSTASYEARKSGIKSGMPISRAWKLCPNCIFVPVNFRLYSEVSARVMEILKKYAGKLEQVGIDEAFLDISDRAGSLSAAENLAHVIKNELREKEELTCSIGIAPNKSVAKIASDFRKPDGLTIVAPKKVEKFLLPLPANSLWGIGRKTARVLEDMGIKTVGDVVKAGPGFLEGKFGKAGLWFYQTARGIDESEVVEEWEPKSMGREVTFDRDTDDSRVIFIALDELVQDVHAEALESKYSFKTVEIKIRYEDFETHTHSRTLSFHTDSRDILAGTAKNLLEPFLFSEKKIRLIGVRVSNLGRGEKQKTLAGTGTR